MTLDIMHVLTLSRGKMLGGTSGINMMAWGRASALEYDSWNLFAKSSDWNWSGLLPYLKKSETLSAHPENPVATYSGPNVVSSQMSTQEASGQSGPIVVCNHIIVYRHA